MCLRTPFASSSLSLALFPRDQIRSMWFPSAYRCYLKFCYRIISNCYLCSAASQLEQSGRPSISVQTAIALCSVRWGWGDGGCQSPARIAATQKLTLPKHNRMRYINRRSCQPTPAQSPLCSFIAATDNNAFGRRHPRQIRERARTMYNNYGNNVERFTLRCRPQDIRASGAWRTCSTGGWLIRDEQSTVIAA